jgi:hypothetical protein
MEIKKMCAGKLLALILAAVLAVTLTACGSDDEAASGGGGDSSEPSGSAATPPAEQPASTSLDGRWVKVYGMTEFFADGTAGWRGIGENEYSTEFTWSSDGRTLTLFEGDDYEETMQVEFSRDGTTLIIWEKQCECYDCDDSDDCGDCLWCRGYCDCVDYEEYARVLMRMSEVPPSGSDVSPLVGIWGDVWGAWELFADGTGRDYDLNEVGSWVISDDFSWSADGERITRIYDFGYEPVHDFSMSAYGVTMMMYDYSGFGDTLFVRVSRFPTA